MVTFGRHCSRVITFHPNNLGSISMLMMFSVAAMAALVPMPRGVAVVRSSVREPAAILKWGDATLTMKQKISGDAKANANRASRLGRA